MEEQKRGGEAVEPLLRAITRNNRGEAISLFRHLLAYGITAQTNHKGRDLKPIRTLVPAKDSEGSS